MTAPNTHTFCRLCDGACGLLASTESGALASLAADATDPVSLGYICDTAKRSVDVLHSEQRFTRPHKRVGDALVPSTWDEALADISSRLKQIRSQRGPSAIGLNLGDEVQRSSRSLVRALSFGVGMGTPHIFSTQALGRAPRTWMAELALGHPVPLNVDLGRAHYLVMLGGSQRDTSWGPLQAGMAHEALVQHSRKTKGTKVVVADARRTAMADAMDQHLAIRPGTEPYLLVGMLSAAVRGGWGDDQYVRDYTTNTERLADLLAEWPVDRCAEACGVPAANLSGVALKFTRSAMSAVQPSHGSFANAHPTVTAWAWLNLHTFTANTLRPGALYDNTGLFDLHHALANISTSKAPRTAASGHPLHLLQAPASALLPQLQADDGLAALIDVAGNAAHALPGGSKVGAALDGLDLLVAIARHPDQTTAKADWVLPLTHPWEQEDLHLLDNQILPFLGTAWTPAVAAPAGESRTVDAILGELFQRIKPGLRGTAWGMHLALLGQAVSRADLTVWERRAIELMDDDASQVFDQAPHRVDRGEADRATWRISHDSGRIDMAPAAAIDAMARFAPLAIDPDRPMWLRTTGRRDRAPDAAHRAPDMQDPGVFVHPDAGVKHGAAVVVSTAFGEVRTTAHHDDTLRPDTVDFPAGYAADVLSLVDPTAVDPYIGTPHLDGVACKVSKA